MELILRALLPATACWIIAALVVWNSVSPPSPLVGAKASQALAPVTVSRGQSPALEKELLRAAVWHEAARSPGELKPQEFVGPPRPTMWAYLASVRGRPSYVLLQSDQGEIKSFEEGALLPDGMLLVKVTLDAVTLRSSPSERPVIVRTYRIEVN